MDNNEINTTKKDSDKENGDLTQNIASIGSIGITVVEKMTRSAEKAAESGGGSGQDPTAKEISHKIEKATWGTTKLAVKEIADVATQNWGKAVNDLCKEAINRGSDLIDL